MVTITLLTESDIKRIFVDALIEYSHLLPNQQLPVQKSHNKLHSIRELAEFLNVSTTTAQKYKNEGCPCIQYGRKVIFDTEEVLLWLKSKK